MKQIVKQVAGIDVAKNELVISFSRIFWGGSVEHLANKAFPNTNKGFGDLLKWTTKLFDKEVETWYAMEATGVYHESLAYYLEEAGCPVSVILPNKISNFVRTLDNKTVTDKTASQAIAQFGLERKLDQWIKPKPIYRCLKQLTREKDQIVVERTVIKNQLAAELAEAFPGDMSIKRMKERIKLLKKQELEIKKEINIKVAEDKEVKAAVDNICSIIGIGTLTAVIVVAETNGFELIRNKRQLVSYAGLDVKEKQSGTSVRGKAKLSKKGNRHLRKAMHMPALVAIRNDERMKAVFARLVSRHGIKMKAVVAIQRKLLELIYTLWKTGKKYDPDYFKTIVLIENN
jgi:transposase